MSSNAAAIGAGQSPDGANGDASREPPSKRRRVALACNACTYASCDDVRYQASLDPDVPR